MFKKIFGELFTVITDEEFIECAHVMMMFKPATTGKS
jgi:hypothetical protein